MVDPVKVAMEQAKEVAGMFWALVREQEAAFAGERHDAHVVAWEKLRIVIPVR
jgi:hypothetical protein